MIQLLIQKLQLSSQLEGKNNSAPPWKKTNKILSFTVSYFNCQNMISPVPFYFFAVQKGTNNLNSQSSYFGMEKAQDIEATNLDKNTMREKVGPGVF